MRLLIVYHSRSGTHRGLAGLAARSARRRGAQARVRRVVPLADEDTGDDAPCVQPGDLRWADAVILGSPTHFGSPTGAFKRFLDSTSPLWRANELRGLAVGAMSSSNARHGGRDSALLAIQRCAFHWGAVVVPPPGRPAAGGPLGVSVSLTALPADEALADAVDGLVEGVLSVAGRLSVPVGDHRPAVAVIADPGPPELAELADAVAGAITGLDAEVVRLSPQAALDPGDMAGFDALVLGGVVRAGLPDPGTVALVQRWSDTGLAGLPAAGFVVTPDAEDGAESGVLGLYTALLHAGAVIVPAGRSDHPQPDGAGNPYGTSMPAGACAAARWAARLESAEHMTHLVRVARQLRNSTLRPPNLEDQLPI
jgi:NAD(P)H dehydrogenase (quinone)